MSTSSLEQAILKISKVMEDFDRKVQDSIEKLTNLDIARGKRKLPPHPTITFKEPIQKIKESVEGSTLWWGIAMKTLWTNLPLKIIRFKMIKGYLNPLKHPLLQGREEKRIPLDQMGRMPILFGIQGEFQHEVGVYDACKNRNGGETEETGEPKCISKALSGISHHEHTQCEFFAQ
ncbi:hypothetical protein CK203_048569 [Vitis vinifera]|uniref:Uncharacterized protein n=1 Tax=Vitis vinifera TaxID=29760 RepID=A0A438HK58_VITVI|nr:hypothetical protein CK203_048569 [Vitis vinifera]